MLEDPIHQPFTVYSGRTLVRLIVQVRQPLSQDPQHRVQARNGKKTANNTNSGDTQVHLAISRADVSVDEVAKGCAVEEGQSR